MERIKKLDTVEIIAGKDKGKRSAVIKVVGAKLLVKDTAMVTLHQKPRRQNEQGTIKHRESMIDACKVMPVCSACQGACRINSKLLDEGKRVRLCNKCKEIF